MWTMIGVITTESGFGVWEYWQDPNGRDVYRRRVSRHNVNQVDDNAPVGARWESTRAHYDRWIAPRAKAV